MVDFDGPDFSPECGPDGAIDPSQGTGWGSTTGDDAGDADRRRSSRSHHSQAAEAVDIDAFAVDPSATCGDARQRLDG